MISEKEEPVAKVVDKESYSFALKPESRALRDAFLRSFSEHYKIGKLFTESGGELFPGRTAVEWMNSFKIIDTATKLKGLDVEDLKKIFLKIAEAYHRATSFHANLFIAAEKLEGLIDDKETNFIDSEVKKYKPNGEYWDKNQGKLTEKRPGQEALKKMAENSTAELRKALRDLKMEVSFFAHILADLETQRRCLKDYAELLRIDPSKNNMEF